jgi:hypothetical protein
MTTAMHVAAERRLDWLLAELLGPGPAARAAPARLPWLAAAVALLAIGAALGVAWLEGRTAPPAQAPAEPWHECRGAAGLEHVPADVTWLRCFDFDDAACAGLAKFARLERLDLSGMEADERGVSRAPQLTDEGVRALAPLVNLRWVSFAQCHGMKGEGLQVLEAMPRLEHLDLTYSGVESPAIERLPRLPSLRTLVLSHCMNFHGRSLAAVASMPGLRRLELRACTTISTADALGLVLLTELRHLDLRDCQGRFRGQTATGFRGPGAEEPPPPPVQDGIGINDSVVAALSARPLETLLLGGCESLTDAIGENLKTMRSLRSLDLSNLPKTTGALLAKLPVGLESLVLDGNERWTMEVLRTLPALPQLRELGLGSLPNLDDETLRALLHGKRLTALRLGGQVVADKGARGTALPRDPKLTAAALDTIVAQLELERLHVDRNTPWLDVAGIARLAKLPKLRELDCTSAMNLGDAEIARLAPSRSLQVLDLTWCRRFTGTALAALVDVPLRELDLYGTRCDPGKVRELAAKHWPGCRVTLPNGQRFRAP